MKQPIFRVLTGMNVDKDMRISKWKGLDLAARLAASEWIDSGSVQSITPTLIDLNSNENLMLLKSKNLDSDENSIASEWTSVAADERMMTSAGTVSAVGESFLPSGWQGDPDVPVGRNCVCRIDLHVHTVASPDGRHGVKQLVQSAKKRGLDAICVCDHNLFSQPRVQNIDGVIVYGGCECSTAGGHILALFCSKPFECSLQEDGEMPDTGEMVARIHAHGGIAVLAHPFDKKTRKRETLLCGSDGVECINARACFHHSEANRMARQFAKAEQQFQTGGSDAHAASSVGDAYTVVHLRAGQTLREALLKKQSHAVLRRLTPRVQKGLSQWKKVCRHPALLTLVRGGCYLLYCLLWDLFSPQKDVDAQRDRSLSSDT